MEDCNSSHKLKEMEAKVGDIIKLYGGTIGFYLSLEKDNSTDLRYIKLFCGKNTIIELLYDLLYVDKVIKLERK